MTPDLLQRLHHIIQEGAGDAGQWKRLDNEIVELRPGGPPILRFRPVSAAETPGAVEELCLSYRHAIDQGHVPPLLAITFLVFDVLCIHPFRDGNGRVSRLLTLLALYQHGDQVGPSRKPGAARRGVTRGRLRRPATSQFAALAQWATRPLFPGSITFWPLSAVPTVNLPSGPARFTSRVVPRRGSLRRLSLPFLGKFHSRRPAQTRLARVSAVTWYAVCYESCKKPGRSRVRAAVPERPGERKEVIPLREGKREGNMARLEYVSLWTPV